MKFLVKEVNFDFNHPDVEYKTKWDEKMEI